MKKRFLGNLKFILPLVLGFFLIHIPHGHLLAAEEVVVYKNEFCGCCDNWAAHLRAHGFKVKVISMDDMSKVKTDLKIPDRLWSCHTAKIGDYLVEGHVPADDIKKLLVEKPDVLGIAVPGMPIGSPGMEMPGQPSDIYYSILFTADGGVEIYAKH